MLEGIEVIMFRTIGNGPSLWESGLPPELLRLPGELARVDALLDDPAFFAPFAPHFHPVLGRPSTPAVCYLRLMFLKFRYRLGYESLCAEVADSISWQRFWRQLGQPFSLAGHAPLGRRRSLVAGAGPRWPGFMWLADFPARPSAPGGG
jgi:transposase, IS5 family